MEVAISTAFEPIGKGEMMAGIPFPQRSTVPKERPPGRSISLLAGVAVSWRAKAAASHTLQVLKVVVPIWLVTRLLYVISPMPRCC